MDLFLSGKIFNKSKAQAAFSSYAPDDRFWKRPSEPSVNRTVGRSAALVAVQCLETGELTPSLEVLDRFPKPIETHIAALLDPLTPLQFKMLYSIY